MKLLFSISNWILVLFCGLSLAVFFASGSPVLSGVVTILRIVWYASIGLLAVCLGLSACRRGRDAGYYLLHSAIILFSIGLFIHSGHADSGELVLDPGRPIAFRGIEISLVELGIPANPDGSASQYVSVLHIGREHRVISVNHPLVLGSFLLYQKAYREVPVGFSVAIRRKGVFQSSASNAAIGEAVNLAAGRSLVLDAFYPDFYIGDNNEPESRSDELNNPILHYKVLQAGKTVEQGYAFPEDLAMMHCPDNEYSVDLRDISVRRVSILGYASTNGMLFLLAASILFLAGLVVRFYLTKKVSGPSPGNPLDPSSPDCLSGGLKPDQGDKTLTKSGSGGGHA